MSGPVTPGKRPVPPEAAAPSLRPGPWATAVSVLRSAGVAAGLFFGWEVWLIKRSPSPRLKAAEAVSATVSLYLVLFASGYYLLERAVPGSFDEHLDRTDALYFTFTTFTTVGGGSVALRRRRPGRPPPAARAVTAAPGPAPGAPRRDAG
ncbi:ion channel [Streptomyces capoamus]|uniref:ion channel n=1 Tax=Streptomyces capoamus TaxID=68183 RepID=UPI003C30B9CA